MKVLMIPSWYPTPGAPLLGTFYKEQAEALAERGVDVAVLHVSVGSDFRRSSTGIRCDVINGVRTYTYIRPNLTPRWERGRCLQRTWMLEALYRRLEKEWGRPDVVNLRSSLHGFEAIALCKKHQLPLFFMEHSSYVMTKPASSPAVLRLKAVMESAKVNACVSHALQQVMQPFGDTRVIPDPVDGERFFPLPDIQSHKQEEFLFRAMGQLRPIKGYDTLIRAFAKLRELTDAPVRLEIAGKGERGEALQALIDELGLHDRCTLVGAIPRDEVNAFMNGCDCFLCSSTLETLSCVLNEAAACGKPLISTLCGGPLDIINEQNGLLVPVGDEQAMAQAMHTMMRKAPMYDAVAIREHTLHAFGRDHVCSLLIKACEEAMGEGRA